jgi:hypothetical protein
MASKEWGGPGGRVHGERNRDGLRTGGKMGGVEMTRMVNMHCRSPAPMAH